MDKAIEELTEIVLQMDNPSPPLKEALTIYSQVGDGEDLISTAARELPCSEILEPLKRIALNAQYMENREAAICEIIGLWGKGPTIRRWVIGQCITKYKEDSRYDSIPPLIHKIGKNFDDKELLTAYMVDIAKDYEPEIRFAAVEVILKKELSIEGGIESFIKQDTLISGEIAGLLLKNEENKHWLLPWIKTLVQPDWPMHWQERDPDLINQRPDPHWWLLREILDSICANIKDDPILREWLTDLATTVKCMKTIGMALELAIKHMGRHEWMLPLLQYLVEEKRSEKAFALLFSHWGNEPWLHQPIKELIERHHFFHKKFLDKYEGDSWKIRVLSRLLISYESQTSTLEQLVDPLATHDRRFDILKQIALNHPHGKVQEGCLEKIFRDCQDKESMVNWLKDYIAGDQGDIGFPDSALMVLIRHNKEDEWLLHWLIELIKRTRSPWHIHIIKKEYGFLPEEIEKAWEHLNSP